MKRFLPKVEVSKTIDFFIDIFEDAGKKIPAENYWFIFRIELYFPPQINKLL